MKPLLGASLKLVSTFCFAIMLVSIKTIGDRVPAGEVVFFRSAIALVPVLLHLMMQGDFPRGLKTDRPFGHIIRSAVGVTSMVLWFAAVQRLPLADGMAITYAAPLMTVAFAAILLGETVRIHRWAAVAVGFVGVLVILWPHLGDLDRFRESQQALGALFALCSSVFTAFAMIQVRSLTATERTGAIVVYFCIGCVLFSFLSLPFGWVVPSARDFWLLVLTGVSGGIGQLLLTQSYRLADASTIAPLEYTSIVWGGILGFWIFGELPTGAAVIGSAIVVASGVYIVYRERVLQLRTRPATEAATATVGGAAE